MARSTQDSSARQHPSMDDLGHLESPHPNEKVLPWLGSVEQGGERGERGVGGGKEEEGRDPQAHAPQKNVELNLPLPTSSIPFPRLSLHLSPSHDQHHTTLTPSKHSISQPRPSNRSPTQASRGKARRVDRPSSRLSLLPFFHDEFLCELLETINKEDVGQDVRYALRHAIEVRIRELEEFGTRETMARLVLSGRDEGSTFTPPWVQDLHRSLDSNSNLIEGVVHSLFTPHQRSNPQHRHRQPPASASSSQAHSISLPEARKLLISLLYPDDAHGSSSSFDDLAFIMAQPPTTALRGSFHPISPLEALGKLTPMRLEELEDSDSDETVKRTPTPSVLPQVAVDSTSSSHLPPAFETIFETPLSPQGPRASPPRTRTSRRCEELPEVGRVAPSVLAGRDESRTTAGYSREPWVDVEKQLVSWSHLWATSDISKSLESLRRIDSLALTVWSTKAFSSSLQHLNLASPSFLSRALVIPPLTSDRLNLLSYDKRFYEAKEALKELFASFGLSDPRDLGSPPRQILALSRHRNSTDSWAVHNFDFSSSSLRTFVFYSSQEPPRPDPRPFAWFHAIRAAWPRAGVKHPDHIRQSLELVPLPPVETLNVSLHASNCFQNILYSRPWNSPSSNLDVLRSSIGDAVETLLRTKNGHALGSR